MRDIIHLCYSECPRSLELYHDFAGFSLEECVDNFIEKIEGFDTLEFTTVENNGELVGYYGFIESDIPFLWTFFIRPKFRKNNKFFAEITNTLGNDFMSGVYSSNIPARKFLEKNGGELKEIGNISYYIFKGE